MWIDRVGKLKFNFIKMYTNCKKSVYIFIFLCYIKIMKNALDKNVDLLRKKGERIIQR